MFSLATFTAFKQKLIQEIDKVDWDEQWHEWDEDEGKNDFFMSVFMKRYEKSLEELELLFQWIQRRLRHSEKYLNNQGTKLLHEQYGDYTSTISRGVL